MRTEKEIRDQIWKSMEAIEKMQEGTEKEAIMNQIDGLLWVIGDRSGAAIYGEVR